VDEFEELAKVYPADPEVLDDSTPRGFEDLNWEEDFGHAHFRRTVENEGLFADTEELHGGVDDN
jgi:hypothetical protein